MWRVGPSGPGTLCNRCGVRWNRWKRETTARETQANQRSEQQEETKDELTILRRKIDATKARLRILRKVNEKLRRQLALARKDHDGALTEEQEDVPDEERTIKDFICAVQSRHL